VAELAVHSSKVQRLPTALQVLFSVTAAASAAAAVSKCVFVAVRLSASLQQIVSSGTAKAVVFRAQYVQRRSAFVIRFIELSAKL
jgi:ribosomal protein L14